MKFKLGDQVVIAQTLLPLDNKTKNSTAVGNVTRRHRDGTYTLTLTNNEVVRVDGAALEKYVDKNKTNRVEETKTEEHHVLQTVEYIKNHIHPMWVSRWKREANKYNKTLDYWITLLLLKYFNVSPDNELKAALKTKFNLKIP